MDNIDISEGENNSLYYQLFDINKKKLDLLIYDNHPQFNGYDNYLSIIKNLKTQLPFQIEFNKKTMYHDLILLINEYGTQPSDGYMIDTPNKIKLPLKIHQKRSLYEMISKEETKYRFVNGYNINLFCDNVGSGKSLTILALIAKKPLTEFQPNRFYSAISKKKNEKSYNDAYYYGLHYNIDYGCGPCKQSIELKTNLIIVPHNVFNQWKQYITKQTTLKAIYIFSKKSIDDFVNTDIPQICEEYSIILIKSTMYKQFVTMIQVKLGVCGIKTKLNNLENDDIQNILSYNKEYLQTDTILNKARSLQSGIKILFDNLQIELQEPIINKEKIDFLKNNLRTYNLQLDDFIQNTNWKGLDINNYVKYTPYIKTIQGFYFQRIIIDEVDSIKIPAFPFLFSKQIWYVSSSINNIVYPRSHRKWNSITSSYNIISNGISGTGFLKDILLNMFPINTWSGHGINRNPSKIQYYRSLYTIVRNDTNFIQKSLELVDPLQNYVNCLTPSYVYAVKSAITPDILKALNAGDTKTAIKLLGCEKNTEQEIVSQVTKNLIDKRDSINNKINDKKNELDKLNIKWNNLDIDEIENSTISNCDEIDLKSKIKNDIDNIKKSIKNYTLKLEDINTKLKDIEFRLSNINDKDCPVCLVKVSDPCISPCCKNAFCFDCLTTSVTISKACPCCQTIIDLKDIQVLVHNKEINNKDITKLSKLEQLLKIINNKDKKYIVFSEYDGGIDKITDKLDIYKIKYSLLKGSSDMISKIIHNFRDNKFQILLLNAKYCGAGLNLEFIDEIILFHRMSKDLENQVIGRAQRIGRKSRLVINYLCYDNEYSD